MGSPSYQSILDSTRSVGLTHWSLRLMALAPHPAAQITFSFPQPCPNGGKSIPLLVARARIGFQESWRVLPPSQPSIHTPTHPSTPRLLRCPGRPMTQCCSSWDSRGMRTHTHRPGLRDTTLRARPASRAAAVYAWFEAIQTWLPPRKRQASYLPG